MLKRAFQWSAGVLAALLVALFLALVWVPQGHPFDTSHPAGPRRRRRAQRRRHVRLANPESLAQLESVRRFLQTLETQYGVRLLVSHDQLQIESSGIASW